MNTLSDILFIDIETVPGVQNFNDLSPVFQELWTIKHNQLRLGDEVSAEESFSDRAGIYAEFGKIVCVSVGVLTSTDSGLGMRIKSFYGDDEKVLLSEFSDMLRSKYRESKRKSEQSLCGHNIREFDIPYLCRRMLVHDITLPTLLDLSGKKPWEVNHLDTMQMWKFGDFKSYTSLKLLTALFDIPTPKDDIDGSDVGRVYWEENDLTKIVTYCQKDVVAVARLWCKLEKAGNIEDLHVTIVENTNAEH